MKTHTLLAVAGVALVATIARAQLAVWDVAGFEAAITNPLSATSRGSGIASASLTLGSGLTASGANDTFGGSGFNQTSLGSAISTGDYLSFTLTPTSGYTASFSSITVRNSLGTSGVNFNYALLSSATGFTTGNALSTYSFSGTSTQLHSITLSANSALQSVAGPIEFRLYGWLTSGSTATFRIANSSGNDLIVNGSTQMSAVPEPSTYALGIGAAALAVAAWKRRRKSPAESDTCAIPRHS